MIENGRVYIPNRRFGKVKILKSTSVILLTPSDT